MSNIKTDLIKEELQERIAKYETWIDGARRFLKYSNDDLENPNYSQFEKDQARVEISAREPNLRQWEKDVEIFKLALAQLEEQEKGWNFLHEPIRMMIDLLNEVYPNHKANIMFAEYEHPEGEESLALTNFPEDGSTPDILIKEVDANIPQVLDLIAHEAAHVIAGAEAEHGPEWEKVYEDIFNAYQHRNEVL